MNDMFFSLFRKQKKGSMKVVPTVVLSVFFGLASGAVGMLFMDAYMRPTESPYGTVFSARSGYATSTVDAIVRLPVSVETASRSAVLFVEPPSKTGRLFKKSVIVADAVASGMVLTSDGWIISHSNAFGDDPRDVLDGLEVVIAQRRYAIEDVLVDRFTGIVLVKVDGVNLPVTIFDTEGFVLVGESGYTFDPAMGPHRLEVVSYDNLPLSGNKDIIRSSGSLQKIIRLSRPDKEILKGSMVVNGSGKVIGVYAGDAAIGAYAIPFRAFEAQIGVMLREGRSVRPYFGVHYLDLAELVGVENSGERLRGVLLVGDDDREAVIARSPAEEGGFKEGDLILAVNGEELTGNKALADLIAEYQPGATVVMTVRPSYTELMDGPDEIVELEVTLGAH